MVLADLFAADQSASDPGLEPVDGYATTSRAPRTPSAPPAPPEPAAGPAPAARADGGRLLQEDSSVRSNRSSRGRRGEAEADEAQRLAVTVSQLEHALASRVRVEQAIGILAERHRLRPRDAFDLLRRAARSRGRRVTDIAQDVVASASNPLIRLPDELARKLPEPRPRGRSMRRAPRHAQRA
ncbi:MAG: ANTAR domain-containing protein [Nocardiopsaceae bacterium]|nr:ANTAR domain-containing protein [Nocardiopsaceae bacterium]